MLNKTVIKVHGKYLQSAHVLAHTSAWSSVLYGPPEGSLALLPVHATVLSGLTNGSHEYAVNI